MLLLFGFLGAVALVPFVLFALATLVPGALAYRLTRGRTTGRRAAFALAAAVPGLIAAGWLEGRWRAGKRREEFVNACGHRPGGGYLTAPGPGPGQKSLVVFEGWGKESHLEFQIWEESKGCPEGRFVSKHDLGVKGERPADFLSTWGASWSTDGSRLTVTRKDSPVPVVFDRTAGRISP